MVDYRDGRACGLRLFVECHSTTVIEHAKATGPAISPAALARACHPHTVHVQDEMFSRPHDGQKWPSYGMARQHIQRG